MSTSKIIVRGALVTAFAFGCNKDTGTTQPPEPEVGEDIDAGLQKANRAVEESVDEADDELEDASKDVDEEIGADDSD